MAAALESCIEENINTLQSDFRTNETCRKHKHVSVIMSTRQAGNLRLPAQSGTDALMLIQSHTDTIACATDSDSGINLSFLDRNSARMGKIGVIATLATERAKIDKRDALRIKVSFYHHFQFIAGMVAAKPYRYVLLKNTHLLYHLMYNNKPLRDLKVSTKIGKKARNSKYILNIKSGNGYKVKSEGRDGKCNKTLFFMK